MPSRRLLRFLPFVGLLAIIGIASGSRTHVQAAGNAPTVYTPEVLRDFGAQVSAAGPVTIGPGTDPYGAPSTVATITVADITSVFEGQTARVYVDCVAGIVCSSEQVNVTGYPISGIIFDVQPTSGTAGTVTLGGVGNFPSPLTGRTFAATMYYPGGGATDSTGNFYMTDTGNSRIVMFDSDGTFLRSLGSYGSPLALDDVTGWPSNDTLGATCYDVWFNPIDRAQCSDQPADLLGYFNWPEDLAVSADGNTLVVADSFNYRVQIFTRSDTGTVVASDGTRYDVKAFGEWGLDGPAGEFSTPWGIALSSSGRILVTETDNDRVQVLDPVEDPLAPGAPSIEVVTSDGTTAYHVTILGHHGDSSAGNEGVAFELNHPHDVAVDPSTGRILVADSDNNRIQVFDPSGLVPGTTCPVTGTQDANCITSVAILGRPDGEQGGGTPDDGIADGWDGEEFGNPWGVTADADGRLFVTELTNDRIQIFDRTDTGYEWVTSLGRSEGTHLDLIGPVGIAVAPDGAATADDSHWLWVMDTLGHRLQKHVPARLTVTGTEVLPASFAVGGHATLTVTVKNTGAVAISGVTVSLPTSDHAFGSASLETATANLAAGEERDYEFELSATAAKPAWHLTARATGTLGTVPISSADAAIAAIEVTPPPQPTLVAQLTAPAQATLNTDFTAQVQVQAGAVDLTNIEITLNAAGSAATITSNTDTIAALAAGATATSFFTVRGTAVGTINLTATFTSDETEAFGTAAQTTSIRAVPVAADTAAPDITLTPTGTGDNGWIRTVPGVPVPITLNASDPSGLAKISYWSNSTELTPQGPIAVTVSGTSASITRQLTREGETRIAYWAEDAVGNPTTPAGGKPAVGESLNAFCSRLPARCTTVKIDTLPPSLSRDSIVINETHTQVSVHFATNDEHSTVRLVCLAVPTPTSPDCLSGPNAQIVLDSGSTTRGTLILTASPGTEVYGTVRVTDFAGYTAEFQLPFAADYGPNADNDLYFTHRTLTVPVGTGVRANDDDPLGNISQWNVTQLTRPADGPRHGTVTLNANGSFTYVPDTGYFGPDDFVYKLTKVGSAVESAPAQVNINVVNLPPVGVADTYSVAKNATLNVNVAQGVLSGPGGDSDPDGDTITASLVQNAANGTLTLNANGSFTYVPNNEFAGTDTFKYRAVDGFSNSLTALGNVATVSITVVNQAPVGTDKAYTTHKTVTKTQADLLVGATDADDPLATLTVAYLADSRCPVAGRVAPTKGTVTVNGDGSFTYTSPAPNLGTDTFSFCVLDPHGRDADLTNGGVSTNRIVTINLVNEAPVAVADAYGNVAKHAPMTITAANGVIQHTPGTDSDADSDPLTASLVTPASHGSVVLAADGSFVYTPTTPAYIGPDSFTYRINDGYTFSNTATVSLTIVNQPPVAVDDAYLTAGLLTVTLLNGIKANDTDADDPIATATITVITNVQHGTLVLLPTGAFTYLPNLGFHGTDTFTYRLNDGIANSNTATVTITVDNAPPVAVNDAYDAQKNTALAVPVATGVRANDSDLDDPITSVNVVLVANPTNGAVMLTSSGSFTYTPTTGFNGVDTFTYKLNDGQADSNIATVTVTIANRAPVAVNDTYVTSKNVTLSVNAASGVILNTVGRDTDADNDPITATLVSTTTNGTLTFNAAGSFTYVPATGFVGTDSFTYKVNDGVVDSNVATVTINITNSTTVAVNDSYSTPKNTTLTVTAANGIILGAGRDTDADNDPLTATLVSTTTRGTLTLGPDGSFTYVPNPGLSGPDTFTYTASDGLSTSNVATVTITVTNQAPVAVADTYSTHGLLTVAAPIGVRANDSDPDNPLTDLTVTVISPTMQGAIAVSPDGSFTYTPAMGYSGVDAFTYRLSDGLLNSNTVSVTINIVNIPPVAAPDTYTTAKNTALTVAAGAGVIQNATGFDSDGDGDPLTAILQSAPANGVLNSFQQSGAFTYTPNPGFDGVDTFTYLVRDGFTSSNTTTVRITVTNQAPVANNDAYNATKGVQLTVPVGTGVRANDTDVDDDPATLIVTLMSSTAHGTLTLAANGSFTYQPAAGYVGTDTFTYKVNDGSVDSATATVTITIANSAPVAANDSYTAQRDTTLTVNAAAGVILNPAGTDTDANGDTLTAVLNSTTQHGALTLNTNGSFTYVPAAGYFGPDSFTYHVNDGTSDSNVATVTINVLNGVPVAVNDAYTTHGALTVGSATGVRANDSDPDTPMTSVFVTLVSSTSNGSLTLGPSGEFIYAPNTGFVGTDTFTYRLNDGTSNSNVATVTITVTNAAPVAVNDSFTTLRNTTLTISAANGVIQNAAGRDTDADNDPLTATLVAGVAHGTLTLGPGGDFVYTPTTGYTGTDTFTYRVNDGRVDSNVATVTIRIDPPNYTTFTQGGWGANPSGGNPGMKLQQNWAAVYGSAGYVQIGGTRTARWTTSAAVAAFLPAGGGANVFTTNYTNATSTSARVFAGQALALRLNIDFSNAGIHRTGLGSKRVKSGKLAGYTVNQVMTLANTVLGGTTSALPAGVSINDLSTVCDNINNNYDNGTQDRGYLE